MPAQGEVVRHTIQRGGCVPVLVLRHAQRKLCLFISLFVRTFLTQSNAEGAAEAFIYLNGEKWSTAAAGFE